MTLVTPSLEYLPSYADALRRGWSPSSSRGALRVEELSRIADDPAAFVDAEGNADAYASRPPLRLPDGSYVARLPGYRRWMWDGEFSGSIGLRWQAGTPELPPWCFGHIGYGVVPWKQRRGYATEALRQLLPDVTALGLPFVYLTTTPDNVPSQRVIEANGGVLLDRFQMDLAHGGGEGLRYRIDL
jgi:predicted acetyltransferase